MRNAESTGCAKHRQPNSRYSLHVHRPSASVHAIEDTVESVVPAAATSRFWGKNKNGGARCASDTVSWKASAAMRMREEFIFADVDPAVTDKAWKVGRSLWSLRELHKQVLEAAGIKG